MLASKTPYKILGNGPVHVLVAHDWLGDHHNYDPMLPYLDLETFTYVFVDLRGYGLSRDKRGDFTSLEAAQDLFQAMDHLGWPQAHVVGHSMSGMIAQRMATLHPERVLSLTAIGAVPAGGMKLPEPMLEDMVAQLDGDSFREGMLTNMQGDRLGSQWLKFKLRNWREAATDEAVKGYFRMFAGEDFADAVRGNPTPLHLIAAEFDFEGCRPEQLQAAFGELFPNMTLSLCRQSGHYPMQETPPYLAHTIEDYLKARI